MGVAGSLKSWASHALKIPKDLKKINVGKTIKKAAVDAITGFETGIKSAGAAPGGISGAVTEVRQGAQAAKMLPWIIAGGFGLIVIFMYMRRR
jgi:hypothetical protein